LGQVLELGRHRGDELLECGVAALVLGWSEDEPEGQVDPGGVAEDRLTAGTPIGEPLTGHTGPVLAVATAMLPDRRVVALTGSYDSTVRVWELTADLKHTQTVPLLPVRSRAILGPDDDGVTVAFACDGSLIACSLAT
jgi:WD40 repeat protein